MKRGRRRLGLAAGGVALLATALPAVGQDAAGGRTYTGPRRPVAARQQPPQGGSTQGGGTAREEAVSEMPTWEAYGSGSPETLEETFFRLSRDFVSTAELGVRRLGQVPVWPRGDLKFGPVRLLPYIREGVEYESNFWRQPSGAGEHGRESAWTHSNQAGLLADTMLAGGRMRVSGSADSIWSVRYRNDQPDTWELDSQLGAAYHFPSGFWVRGGVAWERREDPIEIEFTKRFKRTNRRGFLEWGFDRDILFGSKIQVEMGLSVRNVETREEALDDLNRQENTYWVKASYPFWKKTTRIFARGRLRQDERQSDSINDGYVWGMDAGIEGNVPLREGEYRGLRGQLSVGFDSALYEDETFVRGSDTIIRDENSRNTSVNVQGALQYLMSPRSTVDLRLLRQNQFSFRGNYQIVERADLTFSHNFNRALTGRIATFYERSLPSGRVPQETTDGDIPAPHAPSVNREGIGIGLRYAINEWADLDWSFDIENRNAERDRSFTNYRSLLGVTFYLNALRPRARATAAPQ